MAKKNLESRSIPVRPIIIVSVCAHQNINDPAYQELIKYCIDDIKYNQERFK